MKQSSGGNFHPKQNYCSYGSSKEQERTESTDSIYRERSPNAVQETNPSRTEHCTQHSNDSDTKDGSTPTKAMPAAEEQNGNITSSQRKEIDSPKESASFYPTCKSGDLISQRETELIEWGIRDSPIIKWLTFPFSSGISEEEKTWFKAMLHTRQDLVEWKYPRLFMLTWDLWQLIDLGRRYISAWLSQLIEVTIHLKR